MEATGSGNSPFSFTTVYANIFGGVASGDIIQYFVVAQDLAGVANVAINSGTFAAAPTGVALTAAAFPLTGTINQYTLKTVAFTVDVTVGAAGTYTSHTRAGGLFAAINSGGLTANINAVILDATLPEDGTNALHTIDYGCTGGPYTLTIKPAAGVAVNITGSSSLGLIKLNGSDHVIFDGLNTGGSSLSITNTNTSTSSAGIWLSIWRAMAGRPACASAGVCPSACRPAKRCRVVKVAFSNWATNSRCAAGLPPAPAATDCWA